MVIQRLQRWRHEGKVTTEQINEVSDFFDTALDAGLPDEDSVVNELTPILKRRMYDSAIRTAMSEYANRGDLQASMGILERADRIGTWDSSMGIKLGSASFDKINELRNLKRMPTGIDELDVALSGGPPVGSLSLFIGGSGDGKSISLAHVVGHNVLNGAMCAVATLELSESMWLARLQANISGVPIDTLLDGGFDSVKKYFDVLDRVGKLGTCVVKEFSAKDTTVSDIDDWIKQIENEYGKRVDLLVVDYLDLLTAKLETRDANDYKIGKVITQDLRRIARARNLVAWSACQTRGRDSDKVKKKSVQDLNDVSDSMHKIRISDISVTLNVRGDPEHPDMLFFVAKHRFGRSRQKVGPFPADFACGAVAPIVRETLEELEGSASPERAKLHVVRNTSGAQQTSFPQTEDGDEDE
jgi:archaellum biogenesis ATPase FlaH